MQDGTSADEADRMAVAALGDARNTNCRYRAVLLTSAEARMLREGNWEARAICSRPWLKWLLVEALQTLKLAPGPVGDHYRKLLRSKGKPKATVAAARKFCTYLYWMLKEEWSYTEWLRQHDRSEVRPMQPLGSAA